MKSVNKKDDVLSKKASPFTKARLTAFSQIDQKLLTISRKAIIELIHENIREAEDFISPRYHLRNTNVFICQDSNFSEHNGEIQNMVSKSGGRNQLSQNPPIKVSDIVQNDQVALHPRKYTIYVISPQFLIEAVNTFVEFRSNATKLYNSETKSKGKESQKTQNMKSNRQVLLMKGANKENQNPT